MGSSVYISRSYAFILGFVVLAACHRNEAHSPSQTTWVPANDAVYASYRPAPPKIPSNLVPQSNLIGQLGGSIIQSAFITPGACLPGFAKIGNTCSLSAVPMQEAQRVLMPWLTPSNPQSSSGSSSLRATVLVETALINATKQDGRCWDPGCDEKSSKQAAAVASNAAKVIVVATTTVTMATAAPFAAAFAVLTPMAGKVWSNPDATGWFYVVTNGSFSEPRQLPMRKDTLTPQWGVKAEHVPLVQGTSIRLELVDADPDIPFTNGDDDMGIINIGVDELIAAMNAKKTYQINVQKQTNEQVLFVGVSVLPESQ